MAVLVGLAASEASEASGDLAGSGGGTNVTGLGAFLGAEDPGGYDGATTQGLALTGEALRHLAGGGETSAGGELTSGIDTRDADAGMAALD